MKVLVTGSNGQLGYDIIKELEKRKIEYVATTSQNMDITIKEDVERVVREVEPTHIIHCAAYTAVDKAETEVQLCNKVNIQGTENLVEICKELGITLMYFSTDYVFGAVGDKPNKVDDELNPQSVYAKSKYEGELRVINLEKFFIIRISWIYGKNGNNFVNTMMRLAEEKKEISVVSDQIGSPTYTVDIANEICDIINTEKFGIYHVANEGYVSWADFARKIFEYANVKVKVKNISTLEYNAKAIRPLNSRFDTSKLVNMGFNKLPVWDDALYRYMIEKKWIKK